MAGMDKMIVTGRKATPSFSSSLMTTVIAMITEHRVNIQLITNMETVSTLAREECLIVTDIVLDSTSTVVSPPPVSLVKTLLVGTIAEFVVKSLKSPGPASLTAKVVIGTDPFVALSMAKADAEKW